MRTTCVTIMVIFFKVLDHSYVKFLSQQLQSTLTTAFERHFTTEGFMDMDQQKCQDT